MPRLCHAATMRKKKRRLFFFHQRALDAVRLSIPNHVSCVHGGSVVYKAAQMTTAVSFFLVCAYVSSLLIALVTLIFGVSSRSNEYATGEKGYVLCLQFVHGEGAPFSCSEGRGPLESLATGYSTKGS